MRGQTCSTSNNDHVLKDRDRNRKAAYSVEGFIEAGEALAPAGGVGWGVVSAPAKQLDAQDHEDEDEQNQQQHEVFQGHHALQHNSTFT